MSPGPHGRLGHLRARLTGLVDPWGLEGERRRTREAQALGQRRAAELTRALDLVKHLSGATSPEEAARQILDLARDLFAPTEVALQLCTAAGPGAVLPADTPPEVRRRLAALTEEVEPVDEGSFLVRLATRGETLGVLWVGGVARPERRGEHLELAAAIAELCAMALVAARSLTRKRMYELELRQAQRLESVGRLAAGLAHELNTPVQYAGDSLAFLEASWPALLACLEGARALRQAVEAGTATPEAARAQAAREEAAELGYFLEAAPRCLATAEEGLGRIASIVSSMREFAHPPGARKEPVDLNRLVTTTLEVARSEYRDVAELVLELRPLPPVWCYPAELNQALLNLVVNAAHAIRLRHGAAGTRGRITVSSYQQGQEVVVAIADTGTGIPASIQDHIFDQFFTTKELGRGVGQGLPIAWRAIVDRHGGALTFETTPGEGTTFVARLPASPRPG